MHQAQHPWKVDQPFVIPGTLWDILLVWYWGSSVVIDVVLLL
jgi:hypothetical protein